MGHSPVLAVVVAEGMRRVVDSLGQTREEALGGDCRRARGEEDRLGLGGSVAEAGNVLPEDRQVEEGHHDGVAEADNVLLEDHQVEAGRREGVDEGRESAPEEDSPAALEVGVCCMTCFCFSVNGRINDSSRPAIVKGRILDENSSDGRGELKPRFCTGGEDINKYGHRNQAPRAHCVIVWVANQQCRACNRAEAEPGHSGAAPTNHLMERVDPELWQRSILVQLNIIKLIIIG